MLPADQRLRNNPDFRRIYAQGRQQVSPIAVLHVWRRTGELETVVPGRRIGFVVSKKQGKAVARNRIKRRLREAVRFRLNEIRSGPFDLIFVGRSRAHDAPWSEVQEAIDNLLRRAKLLAPVSAPEAHAANSKGQSPRVTVGTPPGLPLPVPESKRVGEEEA